MCDCACVDVRYIFVFVHVHVCVCILESVIACSVGSGLSGHIAQPVSHLFACVIMLIIPP